MRTGAAAGHSGYFHEGVRYDSDEELLAVAVPFLLGGAEAGEPTFVALGDRTGGLIRSALPAGSGVEFLPGGDVYARPAVAVRAYRQLLADQVAAGARQIRIIGEVPAVSLGPTWDWWARYEATINHAYDDFPLWSMCAYDTRIAPAAVLADVARTHPRFATPDGRHVPSPTWTPPADYLREQRPVVPDPLQGNPPTVDLADPTAAEARAAVDRADRGQLPAVDVEDLVVAVSETVTNALRHGKPPVRLRVWAGGSVRRAAAPGRRLPRRPRPLDHPPVLQPRLLPPRRRRLHAPAHGRQSTHRRLRKAPEGQRRQGSAGRQSPPGLPYTTVPEGST